MSPPPRTIQNARTYRVERWMGSSSGGCNGSATYYDTDDKAEQIGHSMMCEEILEMELGTGAIVEVTVRVITDVPMPKHCENTWPSHTTHCKEANAKRRLSKKE